MKVALDTNVLLYAAGMNDERRKNIASQFMSAIARHTGYVPLQTFGEFYRVLRRKFRLSDLQSEQLVNEYRSAFVSLPTSDLTFDLALELCARHQYDIWDAIILAAAAEARCDILLSEDGHSGFNWRGVTVIDPFAGELHPLGVHLLKAR